MDDQPARPRLAYFFSRYPVISHTFVDNEILGLEAAGWKVVVATLNPPKNDLRHPGLDALRAPVLHAPPPAVRQHLENTARAAGRWPGELVADHERRFGPGARAALSCRNALYFADLLPRLGIGHIHAHFANRASYAAWLVSTLTGIPFSFTPQAQDFLVDLESPELLAEMCRAARFVVAPCGYARDKLADLCPDSSDKLVTIYNGIDPAGYPAADPAPHGRRLRVASVGRLIEFKGFHHLIEAVAVARKTGVDVRLDLLGDGPWRQRLESLAAASGITGAVCFHGSVTLDQMKSCFAAADVFALACTTGDKGATDVLPTVITEAMLCGLPVVSTRLAGVPEQVACGETGILVEPGDVPGLAAALVRLAAEPGLAAKLGQAGRRRALEIFARARTLPRLETEFTASPARPMPAAAGPVAYFDLARPGAAELLRLEWPALRDLGAQVWLAAGTCAKRDLHDLDPWPDTALWLPDGMALEMEWFSRPGPRAQLEALRAELSTAIDGEWFFTAARRALWLADQIGRFARPTLFYAPGEDEWLVGWLVSQLVALPLITPLRPDKCRRLRGKLRDQIAVATACDGSSLGSGSLHRRIAETARTGSGFSKPRLADRLWRHPRHRRALARWLTAAAPAQPGP
jgi:glycosyltransferase involved in cell wall biosynthesis